MLIQTARVIAVPAAMTQDEVAFFKALGSRIAAARKDTDLTQVQLAEALGVSQQIIASYEVGRRRVPLSLLPKLARALSVTIEELIGEATPQTVPGRRGPPSRVQLQLERIQALPRARQRFLADLIETALQQAAQPGSGSGG
jgi:transcriptional regulator with XRE-family HTH domain